jgi:hypothetical protein
LLLHSVKKALIIVKNQTRILIIFFIIVHEKHFKLQ